MMVDFLTSFVAIVYIVGAFALRGAAVVAVVVIVWVVAEAVLGWPDPAAHIEAKRAREARRQARQDRRRRRVKERSQSRGAAESVSSH